MEKGLKDRSHMLEFDPKDSEKKKSEHPQLKIRQDFHVSNIEIHLL